MVMSYTFGNKYKGFCTFQEVHNVFVSITCISQHVRKSFNTLLLYFILYCVLRSNYNK